MSNTIVLILGATSDVGKALAEYFYAHQYKVILAARNTAAVESYLSTWASREGVYVAEFDARAFQHHATWFKQLPVFPDVTISVFGYLGNQPEAMTQWNEAQNIIESNYTGAVSILNVVAQSYSERKAGVIVGISSVAGERGRQSNFMYGSAKAGFTAYLSGLRNLLVKAGVHVVTVKPGFINTKMTAGLNLPKPLTASPQAVAKKIFDAVRNKRNTVYVLPIWFWIMMVIRSIPEFIFKRLKL